MRNAKKIRLAVFVLAIVTAFPLPVGWLNGVLIWTSPLVLFGRIAGNHSFYILNLLGIMATLLVVFQKRWICRYICPLGVVCDAGSGLSRKKVRKLKWKINQILAICMLMLAAFGISLFLFLDPFNIFYASFEFVRTGLTLAAIVKLSAILLIFLFSLMRPHMWCASVCPLGGMQDLIYVIRKSVLNRQTFLSKETGNTGRRTFIAALGGGILGITLGGVVKKHNQPPLRPPFALVEEEFTMVCQRCGNCIAACPTKIIKPDNSLRPFEKFLCPEIRFNDSYCLPDCNHCGTVCPSGAIRNFSVADKSEYKMANIEIRKDDCLLLQNKECMQCKIHCTYLAIEYKESPEYIVNLPVIENDLCTGCAECVVACPAKAIIVTGT